jgi:hypothetical protein
MSGTPTTRVGGANAPPARSQIAFRVPLAMTVRDEPGSIVRFRAFRRQTLLRRWNTGGLTVISGGVESR